MPSKGKKSSFISILIVVALLGGGLRCLLAIEYGCIADIREGYRVFAQKAAFNGPFNIYVPDDKWACDYPPLLPWITGAGGALFGGLYYGELRSFKIMWAVFISLCDMGIIICLALIALPRGKRWAIGAAALWAFNPASLYDTGYWAQSVSPSLLCLVLVALMAVKRKWFWAGLLYGIACLVKPQAWPLAPALALWIWRDGGWKNLRSAFFGTIMPLLAIWFLFLCAGTAPTLRNLILYLNFDNASLSINGHNLWWIAELARGEMIFTNEVWFKGVTSQQTAWFLTTIMLVAFGFMWIKRTKGIKGSDGVEMMAVWSMLSFLFMPCMHENHAMPALALASCAWATGRKTGWVLSILTTLIVGNIILHDMPTMCFFAQYFTNDNYHWFFKPIESANNVSVLTLLFALVSVVFGFGWAIKFLRGAE